jgi:hypothetical protein
MISFCDAPDTMCLADFRLSRMFARNAAASNSGGSFGYGPAGEKQEMISLMCSI